MFCCSARLSHVCSNPLLTECQHLLTACTGFSCSDNPPASLTNAQKVQLLHTHTQSTSLSFWHWVSHVVLDRCFWVELRIINRKLLNGMLLQLLTYQLFTSRSKVFTWGQVIIKLQWRIMRYETNESFGNKARTVIPGCWLIWGSVFFSMAFIHVTLDTLMFMFCIDWWVWRLCVSAMRRRAVKHKHTCEMHFNPIFCIPVFAAV